MRRCSSSPSASRPALRPNRKSEPDGLVASTGGPPGGPLAAREGRHHDRRRRRLPAAVHDARGGLQARLAGGGGADGAAIQVGVALLALPALGIAGLYRTVVRYIDLRVIVASSAALAAVVLVLSGLAWSFEVVVLPRSALPIFWFVAFAYVVTSRFIARALLRRGMKQVGRHRLRTAIYGAGEPARSSPRRCSEPRPSAVCFLDDRIDLQRKIVAGLPVYSPSTLDDAIFRHELEVIVLAIPSASSAQKRRLIERVEGAGLPVKILPGLFDLVDGKAGMSDIREVDVADLLGRDPVPPDRPCSPATSPARSCWSPAPAARSAASCAARSRRCGRRAAPPRSFRIRALHDRARAARELARASRSSPPRLGARRALIRAHAAAPHGGQTIYHAAAYKHVPLVEANLRRGRAQQRLRHAGRRPRRAERGGRDLRPDLDRQGGAPDQRDGRQQARRRADPPGAAAQRHADLVLDGPLRQRAGLVRLGGSAVPAPDRGGRAGDHHPSGRHALLHD